MLNKIFISLACYRDPEIIPTVRDAYNKAENKKLLVFGVYAQMAPTDEKIDLSFIEDQEQVRLLVKDNTKARGPSYARYIIYNKLYKDELYYLQIDSHTRFVENWDEKLIEMLGKLKANSVISTYPKGYHINNNYLPMDKYANILRLKKVRNGIPILESYREKLDEPKRNLFWAAGYSFSYGAIFKFVPFDPYLKNLFWGEEFLMSLRFYTNNIKIYTPDIDIVYTLWSREHRHTFWELKNIIGRKFDVYSFLSFLRLMKISKLFETDIFNEKISKELDKYGIGNRKTLEKYYQESKTYDIIKNINYNPIISNIYFSLKTDL